MIRLPVTFDITYSMHGGGTKTVPYKIWWTPYTEKWLQLWVDAAGLEKLNCWHRQNSIADKNKLIQECNKLVTSINQEKQQNLPLIEDLEHDTFNHLHHEFELNLPAGETDGLWSALNIKIHQIEELLLQVKYNNSNYMSIINHSHMSKKLVVEEDWVNYQAIRGTWGDLVAGYATTGKSWIDVYATDDRNLIKLDGVKPQQHIMAEFYATYHYADLKSYQEEIPHLNDLDLVTDFFRWRNSLPEDLKEKVPKYTQQLSLGKFILGRIDLYRLKTFFPEFEVDKFINDKIYRHRWFKHWDDNFVSYIDKTIKIKCSTKKDSPFIPDFNPAHSEFVIER
jgi:hypothetical protein